ncbi:hypothetical protein F4779DRAFT_572789 [Xylariaceae sp. FL0662B]|nr:hypothetical protein F4779DRAFT_572789 [Xylariaceae sp. FL0662B]
MQFTKIAMAVLAAASSVTAEKGCFTGGQDGKMGTGLYDVSSISFVCALISGGLSPNEFHSTCDMDKNGIKWNFRASNKSKKYVVFSTKKCTDNLTPKAKGCPTGGKQEDDGIEYTADPNAGACLTH